MLRSPGSTRTARPAIPEEAELKLALLGLEVMWDPRTRSFLFAAAGHPSMATVDADEAVNNWDRVLGELADLVVKAKLPIGHVQNLQRVPPVVVEAASVIDTENFNG